VTPIRVATVGGEGELEPTIAVQLGARGEVDLVLRCLDRVELLATIRGGDLDAIVVADAPGWIDGQIVEEVARAGIRLVGISPDPATRERLETLGARVLGPDASVDDIVENCRSAPPLPRDGLSGHDATPRGRLIAVWGPKGAPGRTRVAIELAAELATSEPDTLLIDGDPYGGDILALLAITEELPTVVWAARSAGDETLTGAHLLRDLRRTAHNGPLLLPGLPRAELWSEVADFGWRRLLMLARAAFAYTVCDTGGCIEPDVSPLPGSTEGRNRMARSVLASADRVIAVCRADAIGIKNFLWGLEELKSLVDLDRVMVVANRVRRSQEREVGDIVRRHIGKRPTAYIADQPTDLERAVLAGKALRELTPKSDFCAAMRTVGAALGAVVPARGLLVRMGGR
jgi:MinD-like ATPase involved in chromosome partitioning or flagellar assembly